MTRGVCASAQVVADDGWNVTPVLAVVFGGNVEDAPATGGVALGYGGLGVEGELALYGGVTAKFGRRWKCRHYRDSHGPIRIEYNAPSGAGRHSVPAQPRWIDAPSSPYLDHGRRKGEAKEGT